MYAPDELHKVFKTFAPVLPHHDISDQIFPDPLSMLRLFKHYGIVAATGSVMFHGKQFVPFSNPGGERAVIVEANCGLPWVQGTNCRVDMVAAGLTTGTVATLNDLADCLGEYYLADQHAEYCITGKKSEIRVVLKLSDWLKAGGDAVFPINDDIYRFLADCHWAQIISNNIDDAEIVTKKIDEAMPKRPQVGIKSE